MLAVLVLLLSVSCLGGKAYINNAGCSAHRYSFWIDERFTDSEQNDVLKAMVLWSEASGGILAWERAKYRFEATVKIIWIDNRQFAPNIPRPDFIGLYTGDGDIYILEPELKNWPGITVPIVVHELGHFLGLRFNGHNHPPDNYHGSSCMTANVFTDCLDDGKIGRLDREAFCHAFDCSCLQ